MDFFAHGFWSYIFFHRIKKPWKAVVFGLLPDIVSWMPWFFVNLAEREIGKPDLSKIPDWTGSLYDLGHSFILALLVIGVVFSIFYYKKKKLPLFMLAWPISIIMDVFTHSKEFLPTPFLWPISDWKFSGFSWGQSWFMILNYSLIAGCLVGILVWKRLKRKKKVKEKERLKK